MDYGSSYAVGGPQPALHPLAAGDAGMVLPAPRPQRMHWSTLLFVGGMVVCAIGLLATLAGIPGKVGYDVDGAPVRNKPSSSDPLKLTQSMDGNMKWLSLNSSDTKGGYLGHVKSINRSEAAIPLMVQAIAAMDASLRKIDGGLSDLGATTTAMREQIEAMSTTSASSAATMAALGEDIGFLSGSMLELAASTEELTERMAAIEKQAAGIAANGTAAALKNTRDLNASLPSEVPAPLTTDGVPLDQAMAKLAQGGGTGGAPAPGSQPAAPNSYDAYATGDAL